MSQHGPSRNDRGTPPHRTARVVILVPMAKAKLNSALTRRSGTPDDWVYRDTKHGPVIARQGRRKRP